MRNVCSVKFVCRLGSVPESLQSAVSWVIADLFVLSCLRFYLC